MNTTVVKTKENRQLPFKVQNLRLSDSTGTKQIAVKQGNEKNRARRLIKFTCIRTWWFYFATRQLTVPTAVCVRVATSFFETFKVENRNGRELTLKD